MVLQGALALILAQPVGGLGQGDDLAQAVREPAKMGLDRRDVVEVGQILPEQRLLRQVLQQLAHEIVAGHLGDAEGQVKGGLARGKGVVVLALGDVQHVARRHVHLHQHLALGLFALLGGQALALEAGNFHRVLEAPFVDAPRLPPLEMQGPDVVDVVVGDEPLVLVPPAVCVARGRPARDLGEGARDPAYAPAHGPPRRAVTPNRPAPLPSYAPGAGAASLTHASKIPLLTFDSESFATKGIVFMPQTAFGVHAIGTRINATVNHVYRGVIFQIGANFVISAIVAETADITAPSTAHLQLHEAFPAPVTLSANVPYAICWTRRDGSNTFKLPLSKANTSLPMIGIPERFFIPVNGIAPRIRIAQANPQVGQTLVPVTTSGPFINATVSV